MDTPDLREKVESFREKEPRELLHDSRYGLLLSAVFAFALWIRMIPENGMQYLQALDPYMIARLSEAIVSEGQLPLIDAWRYFPYLTPTFQLNLGDIVIPAYLYHLASPFMDFMTWAQVYPALSGAMMVLAMYFIGKELFGKQAGILAAFFLATAPAVLHRSSAGWFEKEPFAAFLMFTSIYFFTRAWKRKEWFSGMAAGTALGIALTVWGGAKFLVLLYPLIVFPVAFIDEDIENLLIAFTPTLILGHFIAAIFNPSRWSVPNGGLVVGLGVLGMIWIRYYVEEYEVLEEGQLKYVVPGLTGIGGLLGFLSPLYSQRLAGYVMSFVSKASQGSADVVGGTVAENQAAQAGQIIGQIGAFRSQQVLPSGIASVSEFFSGWTFSLIGTSLLIAVIAGMLIKKYSSKDSFVPRAGYVAFAVSFMVLSASLVLMLIKPQTLESVVAAFLFSTVVALVGTVFFLLFPSEEISPDERWYLIIPLLWMLSTLYGATQKSRLLFLTAHPVALMAGYGLSTGLSELRRSSIWEAVEEAAAEVEVERTYRTMLILILVPVVVFNAAAAIGMAQGVGGSPNDAWMENLEFMREETPADSVILSWWDYGYWFETIGARAAIADGGNLAHYRQSDKDYGVGSWKINYPLADFLTSPDYREHLDWLDSLSVDYVVLDSTMIGKYSAVSQIHNRNNDQFNAMRTFSCSSQDNRCVTTSANNKTYLVYEGQGSRFLVPFEQDSRTPRISGSPLMQSNRGTSVVANVCSEEGVREVEVSENRSAIPGCVSFHPYRQHQQILYIPPEVMESAMVNLYVMDAHGMEHFDEVFDNGFVKMWKVDYSAEETPEN